MRKQNFEELLKIYSEHQIENPSYPFEPHIGSEFKTGKGQPRLMFVGKATYGWQKGSDASDFVKKSSWANNKYYSAFWKHLFDVVRAVYYKTSQKKLDIANKQNREWVIDRIVWSNLARIGSEKNGNPSGTLLTAQTKICEKILREEIDELAPTGIVLVTYDFMESVVYNIFGKDNWKKEYNDWFWYQTWQSRSGNSTGIYWSRHPQGWPNDDSEQKVGRQTVIEEIAEHQLKIINSAG